MVAPQKIEIFNEDRTLRDDAVMLIVGTALGLTTEDISALRKWSASKGNRWRGRMQEIYGRHIFTVMVMLIANGTVRPERLSGWYPDTYADRYDRVREFLSSHHLTSSELTSLALALKQLPHGGWTRNSCPPDVMAIMKKAGIADDDGTSYSGRYGLLLAAAAQNGQLHPDDLPKVLKAKITLEIDGDISIIIIGPPGSFVDENLSLKLPDLSELPESAE